MGVKSASSFFGARSLGFLEAVEKLGVQYQGVEAIHALQEVAQAAGCYWTFDRAVVFSDRPERICVVGEKKNKLHCENGPAVLYRDGYALYALNGSIVPKWLVMTDAASLQDSQREELETDEQKIEFDKKVATTA